MRANVAVDACAALEEIELQTALLRMAQAGGAVAPYGALVVELLADNADPTAAEVYQAIRTQYGVPTLVALESPAAN